MIPLVLLLSAGALLALGLGVIAVAWEALHPPRRTVAWALARGTPADPEELRRPWRTLRHRLDDGAELECWEIEGGDPRGPVVAIVHGWGRSRWDSLRRVEPFLGRASRVLLPDLRGHGESTGRTSLGAADGDDLRSLLGALAPADGATPLLLAGHSMGAGAVIRAAASLRPAPAAVIAIAPYDRVRTPIMARLRLRALPARLLGLPAVGLLRLVGVHDAPLTRAAEQLRCPLLVLAAEEDSISPVEDGRAIAATPRSAPARFEALPGADHADPGAGDPDRYRASIDRFLDECLAAAGSPARG